MTLGKEATMRLMVWIAGLLGLIIFCGCGAVQSVHPFYTEDDVIFDPDLLGTWVAEPGQGSDPETYSFSRSGEKEYVVVYREEQESATARARLVELGGHTFLDFTNDGQPPCDEDGPLFIVPTHVFVKLTRYSDRAYVSLMNPEWLSKAVEGGEVSIEYIEDDGLFTITSPTEVLQDVVLLYADDENAFWTVEEPLVRQQIDWQ
jgi:hypothetical protein